MSTPHISTVMDIVPEWIDFNGHMNMAFYNVLFDRASDEFYQLIGLGEPYVARGFTTYTAEFHIRYLRELHLGQQVRVRSWLLDHDEKRFHTWQEIRHEDGWIAATGETLALHIDMSGPRVVPFPDDIAAGMDAFAAAHGRPDRPEGAGSAIGIPRK
ncbi:thioesterase family protein [Sinisalibacter aestuarii]|uniref:Thioesterase n=1 Tax=Sinisalibacter aestuarii TaxID=2949426 RepID=A0ABQ5LVC8_9RHOB|nr:thioesterase family protein [Sinisalibacter aestuarii]GKY88548.1 thioesterase [Sinisalibacter aestuarii]